MLPDGGDYGHSSFSSVDICSKSTFMKERLTPKPKPPLTITSLIQVFYKLSKLRVCGYHQVVWMHVHSKWSFANRLTFASACKREAETVLSNDSDAVCSTAPFPRRKTGRKHNELIVSSKFTSVQYGIYAFRNAHTRFITSLRGLPNVAFETVPIFV